MGRVKTRKVSDLTTPEGRLALLLELFSPFPGKSLTYGQFGSLIGLPEKTVSKWFERGSVSKDGQVAIVAAASTHGIEGVTLDWIERGVGTTPVRRGGLLYELASKANRVRDQHKPVKPEKSVNSLSSQSRDPVARKPTREWTQDDVAKAAGAALARIFGRALGGGMSFDRVGKILVDLAAVTADRDLDPRDLLNVARACIWMDDQHEHGSKALLPEPSLTPFDGTNSVPGAGGSKT
jgi:hypothetical protein